MQVSEAIPRNMAGKLLNHALVFAINVLLVRLLGPSTSGHYFNELYLVTIGAFIFSLGFDYSAVQCIGNDPVVAKSVFRIFNKWILILSVAGMAAYFIMRQQKPGWFEQPPAAFLLMLWGQVLLILFQGLLTARKQFMPQNVLLIITNLLFFIFLGIQYLNQAVYEFNTAAIQYACLICVQALGLWLMAARSMPSEKNAIPFSLLMRQGVLIMISVLIYFLLIRTDHFFVEQYADGITLGQYVQCGKMGQYFLYFSSIIGTTMLPFLSDRESVPDMQHWFMIMKPYILILLLAALLMAITGPWLFPFLFGSEFQDMHRILWILLPGYFSLGILTLINPVYISRKHTIRVFLSELIAWMLVLILDFIFVPTYGAGYAALIHSVVYILLTLYLLTGLPALFQTKEDAIQAV